MQHIVENILSAMKNGQHADSLRLSRELAQSFPSDEGVLSLLAVSEQNAGDLGTARNLLLELTRDHPQTWQHWNNLGNVQRLLEDLPAAGEAYERALALNTGSARLRANAGLLALNLGKFARAREHLCAACTMDGAEPGMRVWAAVACQACADDSTAMALIQGWQDWPGLSEEAVVELGRLLFLLGDARSGESLLSREFQDSTYRYRALARRILALERLNRFDEAVSLSAQMASAAQIPDRQGRLEALQALAVIANRSGDPKAARAYYTQALQQETPPVFRKPLYFGLAKACDAIGDYRAAMDALKSAHAADAAARTGEKSVAPEGTGLLALANPKFQLADLSGWKAEAAPTLLESPVFVVGFPRSGTTLLEQMLGAHPAFVSTDEKPMVQRMLEAMRAREIPYPNGLSELQEADRVSLREIYWQEARLTVELEPGVRLVDKHPLNFLALPLIRRVFPNAPVIFCRRHPCDSILSSHMQDFRDPRLATECASIERLASLYVNLANRWEHDITLFPAGILNCRYEDLILSDSGELARIGDFLGIDDTSAMRNFSEHARSRGFIGTPSYAQVVQPLNDAAVGRWKAYRDYFGPALVLLTPIMEQWGYDDRE